MLPLTGDAWVGEERRQHLGEAFSHGLALLVVTLTGRALHNHLQPLVKLLLKGYGWCLVKGDKSQCSSHAVMSFTKQINLRLAKDSHNKTDLASDTQAYLCLHKLGRG